MEIDLNFIEIEAFLSKNEFKGLTEYLQEKFKLNRNDVTGQVITKAPSKASLEIIGKVINFVLHNHEKNNDLFSLLRQCFVCLRNSAAHGKDVQNLIINDSNLIELVYKCVTLLINSSLNENESCLVMALQFLGNLVVDNENTQINIWNKFSNEFLVLIKCSESIQRITTMILFNIFRTNRNLLPNDKEFIENIIDLSGQGIDFAQLIFELYFSSNIFCELYPNFEIKQRLIMLELVHDIVITNQITSIEFIKRLSFEFKRKSDCILKTVTDYIDQIEPLEVVRLLDILASASCQDSYLPNLQQDKSLLLNCLFLLKSIHSIGKESDNYFSAIQKLSELTLHNDSQMSSDIQRHPGFGFKASLIRIIGNLSYKNFENQNQIRELDCIPLMLDCCNIDARNPLIIQWVVLAMRNLCEGNQENQALIAAMTRSGTVDSGILKEMGLTLHDEGDKKLVVVPLNELKK